VVVAPAVIVIGLLPAIASVPAPVRVKIVAQCDALLRFGSVE
jgi:hypothetical protein